MSNPGERVRGSTPGERRERAMRRRRFGWLFAGFAVLALFPLVYLLAVEVHVVGASPTLFTNCGTVFAPVAYGGVEAFVCQAALNENAVFATVCAGIALVLGVIGTLVLLLSPRRP